MNRGYSTHNKETRRLRLWLKPSTWALIDKAASELNWAEQRDQVAIEGILERWAQSQLNWASRAGRESPGVPTPVDPPMP